MDNPFQTTLYTKNFTLRDVLPDPVRIEFDLEWNDLGVATIEVKADDPRRKYLEAAGCRMRTVYRGEHLMSGKVSESGGVVTEKGTIVYTFRDEWRIMQDTLAWVVPVEGVRSSGLLSPTDLDDDAQSFSYDLGDPGLAEGSGYFVWPDGSGAWGGVLVEYSESAIKKLIELNMVNRLGLAVTIETDLERGGDARAAGELPELIRFDPLDEALAPLIEWSELTVKLWHDGETSTVRVDVIEPAVWPSQLTIESGIIVGGSWERAAPTATRIVLGGPGEGNARAFVGVNDVTGLEELHGDVVEVFRDATGVQLNWPTALPDDERVAKYYTLVPTVDPSDVTFFNSYMTRWGKKALRDGRTTVGLSLLLSETETFHFHGADGVHLGDQVTAVLYGVPVTERIRGAKLTFENRVGLTVTPRVGDRVEDPSTAAARTVARVAASQRRLSSSR